MVTARMGMITVAAMLIVALRGAGRTQAPVRHEEGDEQLVRVALATFVYSVRSRDPALVTSRYRVPNDPGL